ncbi:hypothetical protein GGR53DRAFT_326393 [Hypoxylon sp. FL1150]|nr:hypothetical protein GGR53DRAFT_326393 [Hypoxylon sp. FL1150]
MDNNSNLASPGSSSMPRSRIPLSNRSNSNPPQYVPTKTKWDRKDSSKGPPSPHDSIYDAPPVSEESTGAKTPLPDQVPVPAIPARTNTPTPTTTTADRPATLPPTTTTTTTTAAKSVTPPPTHPIPDPNAESPLSHLEAETPFLYGHGTELATIVEQRSISTLRTGNPSTSDISSLLKHKASATGSNSNVNNNSNAQQPAQRALRRQTSFSLDDLSQKQHSHQQGESCSGNSAGKRREEPSAEPFPAFVISNADALSTGSSHGSDTGSGMLGVPRLRNTTTKRHSPPVVETTTVNVYPQKPVYPPHQSPSEPTGFTEWLAHQRDGTDNYPYPSPAATAQDSGSASASGSQTKAQAQAQGQSLEVPQFRGVRSGHGNLGAHPYMRTLATATHPGSMPAEGSGLSSPPQEQETAGSKQDSVRVQESDALVAPPQQSRTVYEPQRYPWTCSKCGRPADQRWSLLATVTGQGRGARRGGDWCSRCAWRKMVYLACCCENLHSNT